MYREKIISKKQHVFRSHLHDIYTEELRKTALSGKDDKRFIRNDGVNTYAWGHCMIPAEEASRLTALRLLYKTAIHLYIHISSYDMRFTVYV